ncbi:MAG: tRNA (N6-isopentenyl adenosine(37)-C2)-methylthiotransferase MiaB, partial [Haloechinothrix sp.]
GQVPKEVVQDRYDRLAALQDEVAWEENKKLVGRRVELLVATGEGRKDAETHRMSGRARDGRLVHFTPVGEAVDRAVRPGDIVEAVLTYGAPHHLVADGAILAHRRTRAGDNAEAGARPHTKGIEPGVSLGLPTIGAPVQQDAATDGCSLC